MELSYLSTICVTGVLVEANAKLTKKSMTRNAGRYLLQSLGQIPLVNDFTAWTEELVCSKHVQKLAYNTR